MKYSTFLFFAGLLGPAGAAAQGVPSIADDLSAPSNRRNELSVDGEYDSFFGFYPSLTLTHSVDSLRQLSAYATYYTQPGSTSLEAGVGYSVTYPRTGLTVSPSLGLLSGSFFGPDRVLVAEGFSTALEVQKDWKRLSATAQVGYYGLLRQKTPDVYDLAFYQFNVGYQFHPRFTGGVLHEQIRAVREAHNEGDETTYQTVRVGVFGRVLLPGRVELEVAGGWLPDGFVRANLSRNLP
jgi:hypothetical protein